MSEELEARQIEKDDKTTSDVKLADRSILRDVDSGVSELQDCKDCNTCNEIRGAAQTDCGVEYDPRISAGACGSPITSTARRLANLQHADLRFKQSHCSCSSKYVKNQKLQKSHLKINLKVKSITKKITTKYFRKIIFFMSTKHTTRKSWFETKRKINQLASLTDPRNPRRRKTYYAGKTASRLGLSLANSVNVLKNSTILSSVSSSNSTILAHSRKGHQAHCNNSTKLTASNLYSKLMLYSKQLFCMIMKMKTTKKRNRNKNTAYERSTIVLNYIFPHGSNSSNTLYNMNKMEWGTQISDLNAVSDVSSALNSSMQSFNDQGTQVSEHSVVQNLIGNVEPFVKKLCTGNAHSQCILRPNDVLLQYRNKNAKTNIKKSRRVTFRGHHKRFMTRTYGQNFNKMYHTFLAEVNYTNQPPHSGQNCQEVGIGSEWDINIDFGKSQDFPKQPGADPGSGSLKNQRPQNGTLSEDSGSKNNVLQPSYQCSPGVCVYGACDRNVCYKRLKRAIPYGSHASTQSRKSKKIRYQKAVRENKYIRKTANMTKRRNNKRGRENRLADSQQIASTSAGLPSRGATRIGSKSSFNFQSHKETPVGPRTAVQLNKGQTSRQIKQGGTTAFHKVTVTETSDSGSSQVSIQSPMLKRRQLRTGRETLYKEKGTSSKPKAKLKMPNRQAVRIGSNFSFNIEFYKSCSQNASATSKQDRAYTTVRRKANRKRKKKRPLVTLECEPGICVPDKCDPSDCYRRQKGIVTEISGSGSSQVSTQSPRLKGRQLRAGRETLYKEKGTSSKLRPKAQLQIPNRQVVRIGSKCSFNIEFYKSYPQNALTMSKQDRSDTIVRRKADRTRKKKRTLETLACEPGICVLDKCDPSDCYRRQKGIVTETSGSGSSQVSTQSPRLKGRQLRAGRETLYKEKGTSSKPRPKAQLQMPNRQVVRIGSKCSFNIEFYKSYPQNALAMSKQDRGDTTVRRKADSTKRKKRLLETLECKPGICVPDKCDPSDCYRRQKGIVSEISGSGSSQVSTQSPKLKVRQLRKGRETYYKEKGTASKPRPKAQLQMPNRQVVRIGSKCSFNIEFYKSYPQNALTMSKQDRSDTTVRHKSDRTKRTKRFLETLECEPGICVPYKCDPSDCYRRLKGIVSETSGSGSSQVSTQSPKLKVRQLRKGRETYYKEKGTSSKPRPKAQLQMPNRQVVRIGSKCSFNIEFYKSYPQNALAMSKQDRSDTTVRHKSDRTKRTKRLLETLECEPGICVPDKCDPSDCYRRLKGAVTEISGSSSSQTSTQSPRLKERQLRTGREKLYKEKGTSSKPRPKAQLQMPNRQVIRIGSKCSINIEFYKSLSQNALPMSELNRGYSTDRRKGSEKKGRVLNKYQCEPGVCVPGICNANECFQQLKTKQSNSTDVSLTGSSKGTSQGSQTSTKTRNKRQELTAGKSTFYKDKGASSMPRPKMPLQIGNRQVVRIGSKCSFNIEFYKSLSHNALPMSDKGRSYISDRRKGARKQGTVIKKYQCEPGVCVPGKCNANECFQLIKVKQSTGSGASATGSSKGTSQGSQTSTKARKNRQELIARKSTLYKDKGAPSMPRPKMPLQIGNRQVVRIGSKCSFDIEFYKSFPQNALPMMTKDHVYTSDGRKGTGKQGKVLNKYQCEPGVCVPGRCHANECFQQLKLKQSTGTDASLTGSSKGTSQGSQTSRKAQKNRQELTAGKSILYKDKGASSKLRPKMPLQIGNRQVVRIGSKCSFNIEFYKSFPQNALPMMKNDQGYTSDGRKGTGKQKILKNYQCEPGVCEPGKCNVNECFQQLKIKQSTGTDTSLVGSSKGTSQGSQTSTKAWKNRQGLTAGKSILYKDKGASSMPRAKMPLQIGNRQVVRIGSKCSFNIEFYKSFPQNALPMMKNDQGYTSDGRKGTGKQGKVLNKYQCEPGVCVPGRCNANECFQQLKLKQSTGTDASLTGSSKGTSQGSQTSRKAQKNRQELTAGKSILYKDKGASSKLRPKMPLQIGNRQVVRIGSKCSFNIEFYKSFPQNALPMMTKDHGYTSDGRKDTGKHGKVLNKYQCEPGVCVPGKCNANECFQQLKIKQSTGTDASLTGSSKGTSQGSQTSRKARKNRQELTAGKSILYKDKGASSMPRSKMPLQIGNRQVVRIGSKCSFNIEFYKSFPQNALPMMKKGQGYTSDGRKGTGKQGKVLKKHQCEPGVCVPGECNANECFQQVKIKQSTGTDASLAGTSKGTSQGSQTSTKARKNRQEVTAGKSTIYKDKGVSIMPRPKIPPQIGNRQVVRIGSKCSFNIEFYKSFPQNALPMMKKDHGYTSDGRKGTGKQGKVLNKYQCEPGVCVPGKCNANECFQQLKIKQSTGTDASLAGTSKGTSQGSQTSTKARKNRQELTAGKSIFYKDKGASSMPRPKMPLQIGNRQVVRIGSKCSFNIEFYKSWPQDGSAMRPMSERAGTGKRGQALKKYQCEPGVCVPGQCNVNECFQKLRTNYEASGYGSSLTGSTRGSQANTKRRKNKTQVLQSGKATIYKDKGVASKVNARKLSYKPKHNRQVVRIGSDCSFNIEFYKSWTQNGLGVRSMGEQAGTGYNRKALGKYQCRPGVCVSSECNANQCFQRIKTENETSGFDTSLTRSSGGSWVSTKRCKNMIKMLKSGKTTFYKDTGLARKPLDPYNRQAVGIGSMCSFNIEFHKGACQDTLVTNDQSYQSTKILSGKGKPRSIFECEPNICIPGKCNPSECFKQFECKSRVCVPGKCDPSDCIQRLRGTPSGSDESLTGSSISTQSRKLKGGQPRECDKTVYKEKGVSCIPKKPKLDRQCVRIGSSCSFNIEFYKTISPPMMGDTGKKRSALKKYQCPPGICMPGKCKAVECYNRLKASHMTVNDQSDTSGSKRSRKKRTAAKKYECEPGVCIPGKCNAKECFQLFKAKHNIDTDGSLTDSSLATSRASQAFKKRKSNQPELKAGNATFYTERGASTMPRSKMLLHLQNRQAVRIGSTCSFNIEFYKGLPHKRLTNARQIQIEQHPFQYNIDQTKQYPPQYYPSSSEASGDSSSTSLPQLAGLRTGTGKKETISKTKDKILGMKEKLSGMKEKMSGMKGKISGKKEKTSRKDEIMTIKKEKISGKKPKISGRKENLREKTEKVSEKTGKTSGKTKKVSEKKEKDKSKQKKQPAGQHDQGDTIVQQKTSSGTELKSKKRKTRQEKISARQTEKADTRTKQKITKEIRTKRKQSQTRVRDQQSDTQVNEKVGTGKLHDQGDTPVQRNAEIKRMGKALKEKQKGIKRGVGEYDKGDKGSEYEKKEHVGTSAVASPQSSDSVSVSKTTSVNLERKEEAERRKTKASTLPIYKDMGTSHIASDKKGEGIQQLQTIPSLSTPGRKKRVVRIGSSCSFNLQIYRDKPLTPAQAASLRSESTPLTPVRPEVDTERQTMASKITKCLCRFIGQRGVPCPSPITGRGSQTNQRFEYVPGFCDHAKCEKNQCPARFNNTDTGIGTDTYGKAKPAMLSCCTNAATQSRRCPALQHLSLRGPSRAATRQRNVPYPSIVPGNWPFGPVPGYGDNFNRYLVREQALILGSGCGFNVNFFKKRK